ncbi:uncharacterized protein DAT39_014342, partial [Clarias magur]
MKRFASHVIQGQDLPKHEQECLQKLVFRIGIDFKDDLRFLLQGVSEFDLRAAQLHILTLLEHVKEQQMQLAAAVNNLAARLGTEAPVAEMPNDIRAVRKNQSSTNAADSEIDSYAIRWFNLAPDRGGGRKDRSRVKE